VAPRDFLNRPGMISFQGLPRKLDEYNRRQHINAINGDRVIDFAFRSLEANFGSQVPPYSMCVHTVRIESSRASTSTRRLQCERMVVRARSPTGGQSAPRIEAGMRGFAPANASPPIGRNRS